MKQIQVYDGTGQDLFKENLPYPPGMVWWNKNLTEIDGTWTGEYINGLQTKLFQDSSGGKWNCVYDRELISEGHATRHDAEQALIRHLMDLNV